MSFRFIKHLSILLLIFLFSVNVAFADFLSGGTFRVHNPQVNPVTGVFSSGTTQSFGGGRPISGTATSGTFQVQQGTPYNFAVASGGDTSDGSSGSIVPRISGVTITRLSCDSVVISFLTNLPTIYEIEYIANAVAYSTSLSDTYASTHTLTLTELSENTSYNFSIYIEDDNGRSYEESNFSFTTNSCDEPIVPTYPPFESDEDNDNDNEIEFEDGTGIDISYTIELTVIDEYKEITTENYVVTNVNVFDLTLNPSYDKVVVVYRIYDTKTGEIVYTETEERLIGLDSSFIKEFLLPFNFELGRYQVVAAIDYGSGIAQSSDDFRVVLEPAQTCEIGMIPYLWWWIIYILILVIDSIYWKFNKKSGKVDIIDLKRYIKKG